MTLFSTLLLGLILHSHPLHVSYTSIELVPANQETLVSMKFYVDDFSLLFYHLYEKNIQPLNDRPFTPDELALINNYITRSFVLVSGKDTVKLDFARKEQEDEFVWLYYRGVLPEKASRALTLTNKLLLDLYDDQTNLVIVTHGKVEKGFSFSYNNWQKELLTL